MVSQLQTATIDVKGSSSHFINQNHIIPHKFSWQKGYAAYSVSESAVERVFEYIKYQKLHHLKKSFQEEYDEFIQLYGLDKTNNQDFIIACGL
jgi:hypothetical protein